MFDTSNPDLFWLNMTNLALGAVVVVALAAFAYSVVRELLERRKKVAVVPLEEDDHLVVSELGILMADGGERIDKNEKKEGDKKDAQ